jgi:hypothetical protein
MVLQLEMALELINNQLMKEVELVCIYVAKSLGILMHYKLVRMHLI